MRQIPKRVPESTWWACAAVHTLHAPWWRLLLARWFGRRYTGEDGEHTIVGHEWRGVLYFTDYHQSR